MRRTRYFGLVQQGKSQKSKVKSQKKEYLYRRLFRHSKWSVYFRRDVLAKTHLQHIATACPINLSRFFAWSNHIPQARTRTSSFARLLVNCD